MTLGSRGDGRQRQRRQLRTGLCELCLEGDHLLLVELGVQRCNGKCALLLTAARQKLLLLAQHPMQQRAILGQRCAAHVLSEVLNLLVSLRTVCDELRSIGRRGIDGVFT